MNQTVKVLFPTVLLLNGLLEVNSRVILMKTCIVALFMTIKYISLKMFITEMHLLVKKSQIDQISACCYWQQ